MRWILILFVLFFDVICLFTIIKSPSNDKNDNSTLINKLNPKFNTSKNSDIYGIKRKRRNLTGHERIRWKHGYLTKSAIRKKKMKHRKHHHRHEKFEFMLKCPTLPPNEPLTTTKIGVEWSHNSEPYLRILSTGKRFESVYISKVEEWKNIGGQLNVIAYGPRPNDTRYKFEYEEARGWFTVKIKTVKTEDVGTWQCRIKLKYPNSTILQFESRKRIYLENDIPMFKKMPVTTITSKSSFINNKPVTISPPELSFERSTDAVINYSEPPLFYFSKNDGEHAIFSRTDKRRDLLAYVRSDYDVNSKNLKKEKRFHLCSNSPTLSFFTAIITIFIIQHI